MTPTGPPPVHAPEGSAPQTRDDLLKLLDRETAIARATDGRLAVLLLDLRRVDRLHALLKGPSPAMTMALVMERLRKALRPEDRVAPISDEQACIVLPRLAHQSQAVLAAVKLLRRELLADARHVERFFREVRIASTIDSPHVVKVLQASAPLAGVTPPRLAATPVGTPTPARSTAGPPRVRPGSRDGASWIPIRRTRQ